MKLEKCRSPRINPRRLVCMQILRGRLLQFPFGACSLKSAARRCRPRAAKGETKKIAQRQFILLAATGGGLLAVVRFIHRAEQTTGEITHSPNGWANSSSFQFGIDFLFAEAVYHFACLLCVFAFSCDDEHERDSIFTAALFPPAALAHVGLLCVRSQESNPALKIICSSSYEKSDVC
jgi:hypothetical protein